MLAIIFLGVSYKKKKCKEQVPFYIVPQKALNLGQVKTIIFLVMGLLLQRSFVKDKWLLLCGIFHFKNTFFNDIFFAIAGNFT